MILYYRLYLYIYIYICIYTYYCGPAIRLWRGLVRHGVCLSVMYVYQTCMKRQEIHTQTIHIQLSSSFKFQVLRFL
jgi:hypothetical protein